MKYADDKKEKHQSHSFTLKHEGSCSDGFTDLYFQSWGYDKGQAREGMKVELKASIKAIEKALGELDKE